SSDLFGDRRTFSQHHGDRLANIAHLVDGDDALEIGYPLLKHLLAQRDGRHHADILAGEDRGNARKSGSSTHMEVREPAMRNRTAEDHRVQFVLSLHVGNISSAATQEPEVFDTLDRLANEGVAARLMDLAQTVTHRIA